jgi:hypothetical protein
MNNYPPGPGFPGQNPHYNQQNFNGMENSYVHHPQAPSSQSWNNYMNNMRENQGLEGNHFPPVNQHPAVNFNPAFPPPPQDSPFGYQIHQQYHFYQPTSSNQFPSSTHEHEYTAGDDLNFQELRLLNLKRNLYGYNHSFSNR